MFDQIGTPSYMAPELWADYAKEYDSSVDMWAIGVVAFMLLSGKRPFHHNDRAEKRRMIMHDPVRFVGSEWDNVSAEGRKFCTALMQKDPHKRLSASQALNHPWIKHESNLHAGADAAQELEAHRQIVDSLQAFSRMDEMRKIALEVIAFSTPPHKCDELRDLFVKMDTNNSGTITPDEFAAAMNSSDVPDVQNLFRLIDVNGDGTVSKDEFDQMKVNETVRAALNKVGVKPKHFFALSDVLFEPPDLPPGGEGKDGDQQEELYGMSQEERQAVLARRASVATGTQTKTTSQGTESVELEFDDFLEMVISQRPEKYASVMDTALLRQMFRTMIHRIDVRIERYMTKLEKLQEMSGVMTRTPEDEVDHEEAIEQAERLLEYYSMHHHRSIATIREQRKGHPGHFGNFEYGLPAI